MRVSLCLGVLEELTLRSNPASFKQPEGRLAAQFTRLWRAEKLRHAQDCDPRAFSSFLRFLAELNAPHTKSRRAVVAELVDAQR